MHVREYIRVLIISIGINLLVYEGSFGASRTTESVQWEQVKASVDRIFKEFDQPNGPGGGVSIIHRGNLVLQSVYGQSVPEEGVRFTADDAVPIASITKSMVAVAFLELEKKGKVQLEARVAEYLEDLPVSLQGLTLRHLLQHTSGLWQDEDAIDLAGGAARVCERDGCTHRIDRNALLQFIKRQKKLQSIPGSTFYYTDTGYRLLGHVLERITGVDIGTALNKLVYKRYNMDGASFSPWYSDIRPGETPTYFGDLDDGYLSRRIISYEGVGDSGARISLNGLTNWLAAVAFEKHKGRVSIEDMIGPYTSSFGHIAPFGLGIYLNYDKKLDIVSWCHGSATGSLYCFVPEYEIGFVFVTNWRGQARRIFRAVMPAVISALEQQGISKDLRAPTTLADMREREKTVTKLPDDLQGYWTMPKKAIVIRLLNDADGRATMRFLGENISLVQMSPNSWSTSSLQANNARHAVVLKNIGGRLEFEFGGEVFTLIRAQKSSVGDKVFLPGLYYSDDLQSLFHVHREGRHTFLKVGSGINPSQTIQLEYDDYGWATALNESILTETVSDREIIIRTKATGALSLSRLYRNDN
ncbi:MAG: serine hydrolase domain-containing protein [Pseudomonadota bacterium]